MNSEQRPVLYCLVPRDLVGEVHDELRHHFADDPDAEVVVERRAVLVEVEGPRLPEGLRPYVDVLIFVERLEAVGRANAAGQRC
jgi:hypothetical protein